MNSLYLSFKNNWNHYFYEEKRPFNLAITRCLFFLFIAQYSFFHDQFSSYWAMLPHELWHPVFPMSFFKAPPFDTDDFHILFNSFIFFSLLSSIGLFTFFSTKLAAIAGTLMYSFQVSSLEGSHDNLATVVFLWIFAFSNSGDAFSLDSLWRKSSTKFLKLRKSRMLSGSYSWPIKLLMIFFASIYVSAGFSKIYNGGMEWLWGDTVKNYFLFSHYKSDLDQLGISLGLGLFMAQFPLLCKFGGLATIIIELGTLFAPFFKKAKYFFISAMFLWHIGFYFTSSNGFFNMTALYFCWVNWEWILKKLNFSLSDTKIVADSLK